MTGSNPLLWNGGRDDGSQRMKELDELTARTRAPKAPAKKPRHRLQKAEPKRRRRKVTQGKYSTVVIDGKADFAYRVANRHGIAWELARTRMYYLGWTLERAVTQPVSVGRPAECVVDIYYSREITINGVTDTLKNFAEKHNVSWNRAYNRIRDGWDPERAVTAPVFARKRSSTVTYNGETLPWTSMCRKYGISQTRILRQVVIGKTHQEAFDICILTPRRLQEIDIFGVKMTLFAAAEWWDIAANSLWRAVTRYGKPVEMAIREMVVRKTGSAEALKHLPTQEWLTARRSRVRN